MFNREECFHASWRLEVRLTSRILATRLATPLAIGVLQVRQPGWLQVKQILCSDSEHLKAGV
jgi:hypothetical protein